MSPPPQGLVPAHTIVPHFCISNTWTLKPKMSVKADERNAYSSSMLVFIITEVVHVKNSNGTKLCRGKCVPYPQSRSLKVTMSKAFATRPSRTFPGA